MKITKCDQCTECHKCGLPYYGSTKGCDWFKPNKEALRKKTGLSLEMEPEELRERLFEIYKGGPGSGRYRKGSGGNKEKKGRPKTQRSISNEVKKVTPESPEYAKAVDNIREQCARSKRSEYLTHYLPQDFKDAKCDIYQTNGGKTGIALSHAAVKNDRMDIPAGEVFNYYNNSGIHGAGTEVLNEAIKDGGKSLFCFDTEGLTNGYKALGFKEVVGSRQPFNPDYAPKSETVELANGEKIVTNGWDSADDKNDKPDVINMER